MNDKLQFSESTRLALRDIKDSLGWIFLSAEVLENNKLTANVRKRIIEILKSKCSLIANELAELCPEMDNVESDVLVSAAASC